MRYLFVLLLLTAASLTACGQKGPLFLPRHAPPADTDRSNDDSDRPSVDDSASDPQTPDRPAADAG